MQAKRTTRDKVSGQNESSQATPTPSVPVAAVLSFIKQTRGLASWKTRDLADCLKIGAAEAGRVTALLQAQGYIERSGREGTWVTTVSGDTVSGSKPPRHKPEAVEAALSSLAQQIKAVNMDRTAPFRITGAVAFGDFLHERPRVQAADVGINLTRRESGDETTESATEHALRVRFLTSLKGKASTLNLRPYEPWMSALSHRNLL